MAEKILLDEGEYLGEAVDGLPRGRGTLTFADGRNQINHAGGVFFCILFQTEP